MASFRPWLSVAVLTIASNVRAGSPDPRTLRDQLEEQVLDGDRDAEDLAAFRSGQEGALTGRKGQAYVALEAYAADRVGAGRELGARVVLQLPLERFLSSSAPSQARAPSTPWLGRSAPAELPEQSRSSATPAPRLVRAGIFEPAGEHAEPTIPATPVVITSEVARACVRAAWRMLGVADDSRLDSMASRARSSAALPEVRLRAGRTIDETGRLTLSDTDPSHYVETGGATNWFEARLTFRLDRLLFADDEISLERIRIDRSELRSRTAAKVLQALFEWQRAYALEQDTALSTDDHFAAVIRELEASAILDVMTDGWFGRFRAGLEVRAR
jgi:hypothetical protein